MAARDQGSAGPAAWARAVLMYPGLYGVIVYRIAHALLTTNRLPGACRNLLYLPLLLVQRVTVLLTMVEISNHAHIGPGLFVNHAQGTIIGSVEAGANLTVSHGVTVGEGTDGVGASRSPRLGDRVWLGVGVVVAGDIAIGDDAMIGANAVVLADVPARAVAVGVPAGVVSGRGSFANVLYRGMDTDPARAASLAQVAD
ncbi:hypothetical protein [Jatrophihabitans endophyticus]|uniref:serine O-acetyltransferase n=1 Tax=Jatrophihabitans endophyticus TaxID=1206085 RepID=UPI0026ECB4A6|nr:hypothetical protein [Jatrophihabitans endophyticus]